MKHFWSTAASVFFCVSCSENLTQQGTTAETATAASTAAAPNSGQASDPEMDQFMGDLLAKMTLEEKIGQLNLVAVGFGLSFTTFSYSQPQPSKNTMAPTERLEVKVDVRNTGNYDGEEVVQLYMQDLVGSVTRPVKELKNFQKIALRKGERKPWPSRYEPGDVKVYIGTNSREVQEAAFTLQATQ